MRALVRECPVAFSVCVALASWSPCVEAQAAAGKPPVSAVASKDGTAIAYQQSGKGPVLVLVAPALSDRGDAARLAALLAPSFTVVNYDRRGRGGSGDAAAYAVGREVEDIEVLIDRTGGTAALFGSSSGAALALEAARQLTAKVKGLVLFEPPFIVDDSRTPIPDRFFDEIRALVAAGRRDDAVTQFMNKGIGVPEEMIAGMKQAPMWAALERRAHTLPYDGAVMAGTQSGRPLPADRWTAVTARTLVLEGELSPAFLRNAARATAAVVPGAEHRTLPGQDHSAVFTAPQALAPVITAFLATGSAAEGR